MESTEQAGIDASAAWRKENVSREKSSRVLQWALVESAAGQAEWNHRGPRGDQRSCVQGRQEREESQTAGGDHAVRSREPAENQGKE